MTETKKNATDTVARALAVGTPLVVVDSYDHSEIYGRLLATVGAPNKDDIRRPILRWDCSAGLTAANPEGEGALAQLDQRELEVASRAGLEGILRIAAKLPKTSVLIVDNAHWHYERPAVMQAMLNLRDTFKTTRRAVILLTLAAKIPADLAQSVSYVADPLPDEDALREIVDSLHRAIGAATTDEDAREMARELRGAAPFRAEQIVAQSLRRDGIDRDRLRANVKKQIDDTPGLATETTGLSFADIGGLGAIREYLARYFAGPRRPSLVVRIEEIEKALAGAATESSGTSGDALGVLLTAMEDYRWSGILAYGVSGCGKSLVAKAAANEFGARAVRFDLNATKNSLVGESERQIRLAVDTLHAIGGERVFFVASMNRIETLPPELRRRFSAGTWFFDAPSAAARKEIWTIAARQFGVAHDGYDASDLTGADIRDIAEVSYALGCSTTEAATYHVPLCRSAPDAIATARRDATGRYLCAAHGGPYRHRPDSASAGAERTIDLD